LGRSKSISGLPYIKGQQRGYYSGGSFSARMACQKGLFINRAAPRIKAGCGGLDIFTGGISFMNFDYLVKKTGKDLQAAPAAGF